MTDLDPNFRLGSYGNSLDHVCGFSRTPEVEGSNCGKPAFLHLWFGTSFEDPQSGQSFACVDHAAYSARHSYDWHDIKAVCGLPDTVWINADGLAGTSWCVWPAEQEIMDEVKKEVHA